MKSTIESEFVTVDLILQSDATTRCVDAFCLTWIKFERQLRKLTANILYQSTAFREGERNAKDELRAALLAKSHLKYDHFISAIRKLTGHSMKDFFGKDYKVLKKAIDQAYGYRQKIFHGQQTGQNLGRDQLAKSLAEVRQWCEILARKGLKHFGYDGFARDSLHKTHVGNIAASVDAALQDSDWKSFVKSL
jgi:hypothetical protein